MISCQLGSSPSQGNIVAAPDVGGRHSDPAKWRSPGERNPAIPVQGSGQCTWLAHRRGVAIGEFLGKAVVPQGLRDRPRCQSLGQRGQLKQSHVPREQALFAGS